MKTALIAAAAAVVTLVLGASAFAQDTKPATGASAPLAASGPAIAAPSATKPAEAPKAAAQPASPTTAAAPAAKPTTTGGPAAPATLPKADDKKVEAPKLTKPMGVGAPTAPDKKVEAPVTTETQKQ